MSDTFVFDLPATSTAAATAASAQLDLLSLDDAGLGGFLKDIGEQPFRARQLFAWLHDKRVSSFAAMTDLSAALRTKLAERAVLLRPLVEDVRVAADGTRKYQLKTHDGHVIESVWIPHASGPSHHALCISSQVGCAMGCTFCATASLKLTRHLSAGEIIGQVYAVLDDLAANLPVDPPLPPSKMRFRYDPEPDAAADVDADDVKMGRPKRRIQNIVYMGMGEPLHNIVNVIASINLLTHDKGLGLSPRRITVSTSGVVSALGRLGQETGVHLAISLNATTNEVRKEIMPVTRRWSLEQLLEACRAFPAERRRRLTFEYVLLKDINDTDIDARRLVQLLKPFRKEEDGKVNLIPFNAHPLSPFGRPDDERVEAFRRILDKAGVACFVRTTRGLDIDAACGMLGARKLEDARKNALPII